MKKIFLSLLSGGLMTLAWPTFGFPLFLFFGLVPLLLLEFQIRARPQKRGAWKVFGYAYLSFLIWNSLTTYWIYYSTAAGMVAAILLNTLFMAVVFTVYHLLAKRLNFTAASVFLISIWISFEHLHLHWDLSWPWLNLGNGFSEYPKWIQWYEYTGTFGGTLWVWLVNLTVLKALVLYQQYREKSILYRFAVRVLLLIALPIATSYLLYATYSPQNTDSVKVLILQPNIDPYNEKYNTDDERIGSLLYEMIEKNIDDSVQLVLAPETVFADGTEQDKFYDSPAYKYSQKIVQEFPEVSFLSGISFFDIITNEDSVKAQTNFLKPGLWFNDYNSAFLIAKNEDNQFYHKTKLVVGVETFPFQKVLRPILGDIMIDLGGTVAQKTTQDERSAFKVDTTYTGPIICYESVYGQFVNGYVTNGAQFLSIITNDAWWENTEGHRQHLSYARLRAIENRRAIARSANTGISAIIDERGTILKQTQYDELATLKGEVTLNDQLTFYTRHGDYIARIAEFMGLFILLLAVTKKRNSLISK